MASTLYNIIIEQGADWIDEITLKTDGATEADRVPIDLTGYTAKMQVRLAFAADEALVTIFETTSDDGLIELGGADGTISLRINAETTLALITDGKPRSAFYDLLIVSPDDIITRVIEGVATITPGATQL